MFSGDEYLLLPKGMHDKNGDWIRKTREILKFHEYYGDKIGCETIQYAPIGYSSTFSRAANIANDKTYQFLDRKNRSLTLACDSIPSIFREYLNNNTNFQARRISFISPLFRYRNAEFNNRHFTQLGYSIINEDKIGDNCDFNVLQIARAMIHFITSLGIPVKVHINDYSAFRQLLISEIQVQDLPDFLYKFQFSTHLIRCELINQYIHNNDIRQILLNLLNRGIEKIDRNDLLTNSLNLPDSYHSIYKMAKLLSAINEIDVFFDPNDFHSIEVMDRYSLRFISTNDNILLGEGGEYSTYATRFNKSIKSFWSVATGLELLERNYQFKTDNWNTMRTVLYNFDLPDEKVWLIIKLLIEKGYKVIYKGQSLNMKKEKQKASGKFNYIVFIGYSELLSGLIYIQSLSCGEDKTISII